MPMSAEELESSLRRAFPDADIQIDDLAATATIIAPASPRAPSRA